MASMTKSLPSLLLLVLLSLVTPASAELLEVNNGELQDLLERKVTIVDVRRADEWHATGVVKNSHLFTFFDHLGRFNADDWLAKLARITNPEAPLILICQTGTRSRVIGYWLASKVGFSKVYNVTDGIESWKRGGHAVVAITE